MDWFTARGTHTNHFKHGQRKMWLSWVHFWLVCGPEGHRWLTGCQDTGWVGGNGCRRNFTVGRAHTTEILTPEVVCMLTYFKQDQCDGGEGVTAIGRYHQIGLKI